jgi:hypothetical protein
MYITRQSTTYLKIDLLLFYINLLKNLVAAAVEFSKLLCLTTRISAGILPGHHVHTFTSM